MPTEAQKNRPFFRPRVLAEKEAFEKKHRKPVKGGGWLMPPRKEVVTHLSKMFHLPGHEIERFFTYSRLCSHEWSEGACDECPPEDHLMPLLE